MKGRNKSKALKRYVSLRNYGGSLRLLTPQSPIAPVSQRVEVWAPNGPLGLGFTLEKDLVFMSLKGGVFHLLSSPVRAIYAAAQQAVFDHALQSVSHKEEWHGAEIPAALWQQMQPALFKKFPLVTAYRTSSLMCAEALVKAGLREDLNCELSGQAYSVRHLVTACPALSHIRQVHGVASLLHLPLTCQQQAFLLFTPVLQSTFLWCSQRSLSHHKLLTISSLMGQPTHQTSNKQLSQVGPWYKELQQRIISPWFARDLCQVQCKTYFALRLMLCCKSSVKQYLARSTATMQRFASISRIC